MPVSEEQRLKQLRELMVLDTEPEPLFDTLVGLATQVCGVPIGLVSLVDAERQWFKASIGLPGVHETPREHAFCAHAIQGDELFEVPDASADPRFKANPLVTGHPDIRFYAGVPLTLPEGARLGTLCVIDRQPRQLSDVQAAMLRQLAQAATQALVMRRDLLRRALEVRSQYERTLDEQASLLRRTGRLAGVGGWELDLRTQQLRWTEATRRIHEVAPDFEPTLGTALAFYAPEARPVIEQAVSEGVAHGTPWDLELPLVTASGRSIWVRAVGEVEFDNGRAVRLVGAFQDITERRQLLAQLSERERFLQRLTDSLPIRMAYVDRELRYRFVNLAHCQRFGLDRSDIIGRTRAELLGTTPHEVLAPVQAALQGRPQRFEYHEQVQGQDRVIDSRLLPDLAPDGTVRGFFSTGDDVTEVRAAQQELARLNREQMAMLDNDVVGIVKVRNRVATWHNRALCLMFGYDAPELAGHSARMLYADVESYDRVGAQAYPLLRQGLHYRAQVQMKRKDGTLLWVDLNGFMVSPETDESMWLFSDITAMKLHQQQVEHIAFHDGLTGLPNRLLLADRMHGAMAVNTRLGRSMAVCYLDLDGFKAVNDLHGHEAGDRLLREMASRLQACVRETDTVARLGGDEFVIVLTPLADSDECLPVLDRVGQALRRPVDLGGGRSARVSSSIGVACFPAHAGKPSDLLKRADEAMYIAKGRGKNQVVMWSPPAGPQGGGDAAQSRSRAPSGNSAR